MRHTCDYMVGEDAQTFERCDKPAVESYTDREGNIKFLCADHWDTRVKLLEIFDRLKKNRNLRKNM